MKPISQRNTQSKMLLALSTVAVVSIFPFMVFRIINHDWYVAIVDAVIVFGMALVFIYVYKTDNIKTASLILVLLAFLGNVISFYIKGMNQVYWIYPALLISYYIMNPQTALFINFFMLVLYMPKILSSVDIVIVVTILISVLISNLVAYFFAAGLKKQENILTKLASEDYLTETGNRRALEENLLGVYSTLKNHDKTASLIILDLDHFKKINDTYGHLKGDEILVKLSKLIKDFFIQDNYSIYRYGGEEFLIMCCMIDKNKAFALAETFRRIVKNNLVINESPITISLGVAEYSKEETSEEWIHRVDLALYQAKKQGRDRVVKAL